MTTVLDIQRALLARGFDIGKAGADGRLGKNTLDALMKALEAIPARSAGSGLPAMKTSPAGRAAITQREGNILNAYPDPATGGEPWTIGVGHTSAAGPPKVMKGMRITAAESDAILARDLAAVEKAVSAAVTVPLRQAEFDALVSLAFNIGNGAFAKSTLVKKLNAGDRTGAADQFLVWNKAAGKVMAGLTSRRQSERKQFLS